MNHVFSVGYGCLVAAVYISLKLFDPSMGLGSFAVASSALAAIHFVIFPTAMCSAWRSLAIWNRAIGFAAVQILILSAQEHGSTSLALSAAILGYSFAIILSNFTFRDERKTGSLISTVFLSVGICLLPEILSLTFAAFIAGIIQGLVAIQSRSLMRKRESVTATVGYGFFAAGVFSGLYLVTFDVKKISIFTLAESSYLLFLIGSLAVIQYGYFWIMRNYSLQRASILILSRIPWAIAIEAAISFEVPSARVVVAAMLILMATAITSSAALETLSGSRSKIA